MLFSRRVIEAVAAFLAAHPAPARRRPGDGRLLRREAARGRRGGGARRPALPARHRRHAQPAGGARPRRATGRAPQLAERLVALGAPAALVTGGHGDDAGRPSLRRPRARRDPGRAPSTSPRRTVPAAPTRRRSRRCSPVGCRLPRRPARPRRVATEAVRHGLTELGAGDGPVDVLNVKGMHANR